MTQWLEKLQEFQFSIVHYLGRRHMNADALSTVEILIQAHWQGCLHPVVFQADTLHNNYVTCNELMGALASYYKPKKQTYNSPLTLQRANQ